MSLMLRLFIPVPPFNCFLYFPRHPLCPDSLPILHPKTDMHRSLHPIIPLLPVLDRLSTWTRVHYRRPPPPVSEIAALPPSTCSPGLCWPLEPHAARLFLPPCPTSGRPPFAALGKIQAPLSTPVVLPFLVSVLLPPFLEPLLPPVGLDLRPGPCRSRGEPCLQFLASCPPPPCFLLTRSCATPSLGFFW